MIQIQILGFLVVRLGTEYSKYQEVASLKESNDPLLSQKVQNLAKKIGLNFPIHTLSGLGEPVGSPILGKGYIFADTWASNRRIISDLTIIKSGRMFNCLIIDIASSCIVAMSSNAYVLYILAASIIGNLSLQVLNERNYQISNIKYLSKLLNNEEKEKMIKGLESDKAKGLQERNYDVALPKFSQLIQHFWVSSDGNHLFDRLTGNRRSEKINQLRSSIKVPQQSFFSRIGSAK